MARMNGFGRLALAGCLGAIVTGAGGAAWALDVFPPIFQSVSLGSSCNVYVRLDPVFDTGVYLQTSISYFAPAGSIYLLGGPSPYGGPITAAALQSCGLTNVTNLRQNGADFTTADLDNYMGFSFRATDPADGKTYDYEYALKGVSNT